MEEARAVCRVKLQPGDGLTGGGQGKAQSLAQLADHSGGDQLHVFAVLAIHTNKQLCRKQGLRSCSADGAVGRHDRCRAFSWPGARHELVRQGIGEGKQIAGNRGRQRIKRCSELGLVQRALYGFNGGHAPVALGDHAGE